MHFSFAQIVAILLPFLVALGIIRFWYVRDCQKSQNGQQEKLPTLISVFFWGAFGGLMLKLLIDTVYHFDSQNLILTTTWFYLVTIFLEEFIKAGALVIGLEIAGQRFDEISDGIVYGAMSALGFLFFENIFYLLETSTTREFWVVLSGRYLFTFSIHLLSTATFGLTYAKAYLGYNKRLKAYKKKFNVTDEALPKPKPYDIFHHFKYIITKGNHLLNVFKLFLCFDLFRAVYLILSKQETKLITKDRFLLFPSIFIIEGFLLGFYLHLLCNLLLQNQFFGWLIMTVFPLFSLVLYLGFYRLDRE